MIALRVFLALSLCVPASSTVADTSIPSFEPGTTGPPVLTFDELTTLATVDPPPAALQQKLDTLLSTPFVNNNEAEHAPIGHLERPGAGLILRVAEWNINRTPRDGDVKLALAEARGFLDRARQNPAVTPKKLTATEEQITNLQKADIVILDEIDDGVDRENYHNVPQELAKALHMNFAYAVEFIELNRIYMGVKRMDTAGSVANVPRGAAFGLDPRRYLGLEGTALLSRYPIRSARIVHLPEEYDWYHQEIRALSDLEKARRWTAEKLFNERIRRQVRRGSRLALIADLEIPGSPTGIVTVICPHLEDYCGPAGRRAQMKYLLTQLPALSNPVIMGGDLNTLRHNGQPLTFRDLLHTYLLNYHFWLGEAFYFFVPVPGIGEIFRGANYVKNLHDPTAVNIPVFFSDPSRPLFDAVRSFRFDDGGRFDFDGNTRYSYHHHGRTLADSSQRTWKGFEPTFSFARTFGGLIGAYKIDWFFIKTNPARSGEFTWFPEFGRTLPLVNTALSPRISDHCPTTIDLPLNAGSSNETAQMGHQ